MKFVGLKKGRRNRLRDCSFFASVVVLFGSFLFVLLVVLIIAVYLIKSNGYR